MIEKVLTVLILALVLSAQGFAQKPPDSIWRINAETQGKNLLVANHSIDMTKHLDLGFGYWETLEITESSVSWNGQVAVEHHRSYSKMRFHYGEGAKPDAAAFVLIDPESSIITVYAQGSETLHDFYFYKAETAMRFVEWMFDPASQDDDHIPSDIKEEMILALKGGKQS